jgi:hypothetical protein
MSALDEERECADRSEGELVTPVSLDRAICLFSLVVTVSSSDRYCRMRSVKETAGSERMLPKNPQRRVFGLDPPRNCVRLRHVDNERLEIEGGVSGISRACEPSTGVSLGDILGE